MSKPSRLATFKMMGFDLTENVPFTKRYRIGCSQCQAMAINGVACHEHGCPNQPRDNDQEDF